MTTQSSSESQTNTAALTTFSIFPDLPKELQLSIWKAARPAARFIKLMVKSTKHLPNCQPPCSCEDITNHIITSAAPIPTILHACQDSRNAALDWYRLSFGIDGYPSTVYFDASREGIFCSHWQPSLNRSVAKYRATRRMLKEFNERFKLLRLAFHDEMIDYPLDMSLMVGRWLPALEEVYLMEGTEIQTRHSFEDWEMKRVEGRLPWQGEDDLKAIFVRILNMIYADPAGGMVESLHLKVAERMKL